MKEVQLYNRDNLIKFKQFESQNLSYSVFENIDFHECAHPVSFFRSDFRGTKFEKIKFYKNNFDRSDFLNSVFIDCSFEKVQFGCCQVKNCYFENAKFSNNLYRNTSIHSTTFVGCDFPDEAFLINMQHCKLINCTFKGCTFEMSTTDSDIFDKCKFYNTNLATMHAENHKFVNCQFDNVCIGSSYFFGYSIAQCTWNEVFFLYRGEFVDMMDMPIGEFLKKFEVERRYNDIINLYIFKGMQGMIPDILRKSLDYYKNSPYGRMLDISTLLENLTFSAINETVDYEVLNECLEIIMDTDISNYNLDERIEISALSVKLQNALYLANHSKEYLEKINKNRKSVLTLRFDSDDYEKCVEAAKQLLDSISDQCYWTLIGEQKGSWTLIYVASTIIVLSALPKIIKNYSDVYFDIKTKKTLSKNVQQKLESTDISLKDIQKLIETSQEAELLIPAGKCIDKDVSKNLADVAISAITANM